MTAPTGASPRSSVRGPAGAFGRSLHAPTPHALVVEGGRAVYGRNHREPGWWLAVRGMNLVHLGRPAEARAALEEGRRMLLTGLGPNHEKVRAAGAAPAGLAASGD